MDESLGNFAKGKKQNPKHSICFVSIYMTFWEKQYYTIREEISSCLGLEVREGLTTNKFGGGVIYLFYIVHCCWIYKPMFSKTIEIIPQRVNFFHKKIHPAY